MRAHLESVSGRDACLQAFDGVVLEFLHVSTHAADEVIVVIATGGLVQGT